MMTTAWSLYISIISIACWCFVVGVLVLVLRTKPKLDEDGTTGHEYDGLKEYDKPMPMWWLAMFWATIVWAVFYAFAYPALGNNKPFITVETSEGTKPWTSANEVQRDLEVNNAVFTTNFNANFAGKDIATLSQDPKAIKAGQRLFLQNCAVCHGSTGKGANGYPNLTDKDWLFGGTPDKISETLHKGRLSAEPKMPAWGDKLGAQGVNSVAEYVLSLSDSVTDTDPQMVAQGATIFTEHCAVCHGADGKGNQGIGSPNLTDTTWLFGDTRKVVRDTIRDGRSGQMPAWSDRLGEERITLLTAYVYSLSNN